MVSPVPPLGLFHTGSPSHCAAAGVARNADNATVNAARIRALSGGWWRFGRLEEVGGGCGGSETTSSNLPQPPQPSQPAFSVHPHGADRHAGEGPVAQPARDAREIGRASCRERGEIPAGAGTVKKTAR